MYTIYLVYCAQDMFLLIVRVQCCHHGNILVLNYLPPFYTIPIFPLNRRIFHLLYHWRAGASQPSRTTGTTFLYISGNACSDQSESRITYTVNVLRDSKCFLDSRIICTRECNISQQGYYTVRTQKVGSCTWRCLPSLFVFTLASSAAGLHSTLQKVGLTFTLNGSKGSVSFYT